jgi:hypothetical protein
MQEVLNDLLENSRYFLEAQDMGSGPGAQGEGAARGLEGVLAALEQESGAGDRESGVESPADT